MLCCANPLAGIRGEVFFLNAWRAPARAKNTLANVAEHHAKPCSWTLVQEKKASRAEQQLKNKFIADARQAMRIALHCNCIALRLRRSWVLLDGAAASRAL